jgi:hypothetical protein
MVPPGWQHPKNGDGRYIPLLKGSFSEADAIWSEEYDGLATRRGPLLRQGRPEVGAKM